MLFASRQIKPALAAAKDFAASPAVSEREQDTNMSTARRVLIVDDDEELRETLKDQLILHDEFEVETIGTASKGMELAKSDHYDLVVFDVSLPDMDGRGNRDHLPLPRVREPERSGLARGDRAREQPHDGRARADS